MLTSEILCMSDLEREAVHVTVCRSCIFEGEIMPFIAHPLPSMPVCHFAAGAVIFMWGCQEHEAAVRGME